MVLSVRLAVRQLPRFFCHHAQQTGKKRNQWVQRYTDFNGDFRKSVVQKLWRENQVNKKLTLTGCACSVDVEGTRSRNKQRVSTPACYLLL